MATITVTKPAAAIEAAKSVTWNGPGDYGAPVQRWGNDTFTNANAGAMRGRFSNSGYIEAALLWTCQQFAQAPFCVTKDEIRADGNSVTQIQPRHDILPLLKYPCGRTRGAKTRTEFLELMIRSYKINGNAYAYRRLKYGYTYKLQYLPHWRVTPVLAPGSKEIDHYLYSPGTSGTIKIPANQMVHWKQGQDPANEALGMSPLVKCLRESMTEEAAAAYTNFLLMNMGTGNRVVSPATAEDAEYWDEENTTALGEKFNKTRGNGAGGDILSNVPLKVQELTNSPESMGLSNITLVPKEKIIAIMGVDPAVLHLTMGYPPGKSTDKQGLNAIAWQSALLPIATSLCERLTIDLLPDYGNIEEESIWIDTSKVWALAQNQDNLHTQADKGFLSGRLTQNEARAKTGHPPIDGGERTHMEFAQLINANGKADNSDAMLNGTNGKLPNETDRNNDNQTVETGDNS